MKQQPELSQEEIFLGQLYCWIHQRAKYLRQREKAVATSEGTDDTTDTKTDKNITSENPARNLSDSACTVKKDGKQ